MLYCDKLILKWVLSVEDVLKLDKNPCCEVIKNIIMSSNFLSLHMQYTEIHVFSAEKWKIPLKIVLITLTFLLKTLIVGTR